MKKNLSFIKKYKAKYYEAREKSGFNVKEDDDSFMKYLGDDLDPDLGF